MFRIRYTNKDGKVVFASIHNITDLRRIIESEEKNIEIDVRIGDNMPSRLHDAITKHNSTVQAINTNQLNTKSNE